MKTVKRKAEVGERILIVNKKDSRYKNGDVFEVESYNDFGCPRVRDKSGGLASVYDCEYEVIIEDESEKPSTEEEAKRVADALALCMEETNKTSDQAGESISGVIPPHSEHYHQTGIDPLEVMRQTFPAEQYEGFLRGNALKYIMRYPLKGTPVDDLEKAGEYVKRLLEHQRNPEGRTKVILRNGQGEVIAEGYEGAAE